MQDMKYCLVILAILILMLLPKSAWADHYVYLVEDPTKQVADSSNLPENFFGFVDWYVYSTFGPGWESNRTMRWSASGADIQGWFQTAVTAWQTDIDTHHDLDWHEWDDVTNANPKPTVHINVIKAACPGLPSARACFRRTHYTAVSPQDARFWWQSEVYLRDNLNPGQSFAAGYLAAQLKHELGHAYGLHEQYRHTPACNNTVTTIMDAGVIIGNVIQHCDGNNIQPIDQSRIESAYLSGYYTNINRYASGPNFVSSWKDYAWHDSWMWMNYYKWNGYVWEYKGTKYAGNKVGVHNNLDNRTITVTQNVKSQWGAGSYFVCNYPWVGQDDNGINQVGSGTCTSSVTIS